MRTVRSVITWLVCLAAATLAGPLVFLGSAGAQTTWTCGDGESPYYYPCVPATTDLNCDDIGFSVHVGSEDPYDLDGDDDGIGCDREYGQPAALPTATPAPADPTPTPADPDPTPTVEGLMPAVDGQCLSLEFETSDLAPVTIVTPDGNVTSLVTDAGQWVVDGNNNVMFTPVVNAAYPTGVNLNGTTNGKPVAVTAIAECLSGKLAQTGTTPPTPAPTQATPAPTQATPAPTEATPAPTGATPAPTQAPTTDPKPEQPALAYTGAPTTSLAIAGVLLVFVGGAALVASDRIRG